jgi:beta-glucosidase
MTQTLPQPVDAAELDRRVEDLLGRLTLREKAQLLSGKDIWNTMPIERLGIPSLVMTDGPHGVRASNPETGRPVHPTTCFPTGVAMAASWDPELIERVGQALGEETRAMECDILLAPCVNIARTPIAGRNFESYAEDPYLAGRIAVAYIRGVQSRGVGTSLKHYACNNQEIERFRSSSNLDERTLREIYLPAFEAAVKETQPWTVMCSYNRINGVYASQHHHLLREILKGEWGFKGFVVSDWDANHTVFESVQGGLDLEMPGPAKYYGTLLAKSVYTWQLEESVLDDSVRRILRIILLSGKLDGPVQGGSVNTPEHQALARELAEESATLLKNEGGLLPLDRTRLKTVAVIGPNADEARIGGGGSSFVVPPYTVSPLEGLRRLLGDEVEVAFELGADNYDNLPVIRSEWLTPTDGSDENGMRGEYFTNPGWQGSPAMVRTDPRPDFWWFGANPIDGVTLEPFSARWSSTLRVPTSGLHTLDLVHTAIVRVLIDGEQIFSGEGPAGEKPEHSYVQHSLQRQLSAGQDYKLVIEFSQYPNQEFANLRFALAYTPDPAQDDRIARAVELAGRSDVALIFAGMPENFESEGHDRPNLELPGRQNELISAVAAANPNTVVVLNAGSPVTLPWLDQVPALLLAYYPGQEAGSALARLLLGEVSPSGKLTVTFPHRFEDTPAFINHAYPGGRDVNYGEGVFVGYRYFDMRQIEPLFPFGAGLSYTTFEYSNLQVPTSAPLGQPVQVSLTITNTGERTGKEVVQLYVSDLQASLPRPPKELKRFAKVHLQPGESKTVTFELDDRALAFYDILKKDWVVEPGQFEILVGSSSRDIRAAAVVKVE